MDRSSRHGLRSERISNSPYKRPPASELKKSTSTTFSTVKSIFSYALSPLFRSSSSANLTLPSTTADLRQIEQKSESGSEDGWNGDAPVITDEEGAMERRADLFDLAAAGGRSGQDFEERAAKWRARGEVVGGRRDMAGRNLEGMPAPAVAASSTATLPNNSLGTSSTGSAFAAYAAKANAPSQSNALKRPLPAIMPSTPAGNGFSAVPTPSFLPPASTPGRHSKSASSAALAAFLEAKKDAPMTEEDLRVIDTLTHNLHVEAASPTQSHGVALGGWSAGTPRATRSLPRVQDTPLKPAFPTSGSAFELGLSAQSPAGASPYRQRYLGVGMSPRRMLGKQRTGAGIKPLFQMSLPAEDLEGSATKKRKGENSGLEVEVETEADAAPTTHLSKSISMPELPSPTRAPRMEMNKKADNRPHPLSQSTIVSNDSQPEHVAKGKKRAADIMRQLIEEQIAPIEAAEATGALTSDIIINPYDTPSAKAPSPADRRVYDSPRKSLLRASVRDTPKRGAAAKLELHRSTNGPMSSPSKSPLPTKPAPRTSNNKRVERETPIEADPIEVDELDDEEPSPADTSLISTSVPPPPQPIKAPEPFKPYEVPVLDTLSRPIPSFVSPAISRDETSSPSPFTTAQRRDETPAPKFSLPAPRPITPVEEATPVTETLAVEDRPKEERFDATNIWMSARDTALAILKPALPFFTFDAAFTNDNDTDDTKRAKAAALKAPVPTFTFTLSAPTPPAPAATPFQWPAGSAPKASQDEWSCPICMIKNKNSAANCVACEGPKPAEAAAATSSIHASAPTPFQWPAGSAPKSSQDEWSCPICMIKNKNSAAKCAACEGPRPADAAPPTAAPKSTTPAPAPFQWPGAAPKVDSDQWTCSVCMCKSPNSAAKCVVCENPRG